MSFLGPKPAKSTSMNVNNDLIKSTYGGMMDNGVTGDNFLASLLTGTGDTGAATAGYNNYLQMAGYAPAMRQLSQQITGQGAASGLLRSGATQNALLTRGTELNNQFFNNYLQNLTGLSNLGLQAGGLVANTGQESKSTGGGPGLLGSLGSLAGGVASVLATPIGGPLAAGTLGAKIFSDRRLKRNIELVAREADGLGVYLCRYLWSRTRRIMVMADEVARFRPWALGPTRFGFATVNYGAL